MKKSIRIIFSVLGTLISYLCIYFPLSFTSQTFEKETRHLVAIVIAVLIGIFLWLITKDNSRKFINQLYITAIIIGGIGFAIGFIGPIIFYPDSNQGPLLGIFITGPLSFLVGLIGGGIYWRIKLNKDKKMLK